LSLPTQNKECENCGETNPILIEKHHIFGKNFDPEIMMLCKNCHYKITHEQNKLGPEKRSKKASKSDLEKLALLSLGTLFKVFGETMIEISRGNGHGK